MDDADAPEPSRRSNWPMFLIFGLMGICVILSIVIYQRSADQPATLSDSGFSFTKVEADKPLAIEPLPGRHWGGPGIQPNSSLKMVEPTSDESILASVVVGTRPAAAAQPPAQAAPGKPAEPPPQQLEKEKLTAGEEKVLTGIFGVAKWDMSVMTKYATDPALIPKIADKLFPYPRILGVILNNQLVAKAFMSSPAVQWLCKDKKNLASFLADGKTPNGSAPWVKMLHNAARYHGTTQAIMESTSTSSFLNQCGPVQELTRDQGAIVELVNKNPELSRALPTFMQALSYTTGAEKLYGDVQKIQLSLGAMKN